jgi:EmrB/QacA subfamily drug resistance transporter
MSRGNIVLVITSLGSFLSVLNSTSLLIALPSMMVDLKMSFFLVIWVLTAYSIALAVLSPVLGKYSDVRGRKNIYSIGYLIFFIGSLLAGVSPNSLLVLVARILQGAGAACLFSNSLAIITDNFKGVELQRAMGINAAVVGLGTAIGPILGGALTQLTWRLVFLFNAPIAILGYLISVKSLPSDSVSGRNIKMDWLGSIIFSMLMIILIAYLTLGPIIGWLGEDASMPISALILLVMLILIEGRAREPMINPNIFSNKRFSLAITSTLLNSIIRYSLILLLVLYLQGPAGYTPLEAGLIMTPYAVAMGLSSFYSPKLIKYINSDTIQSIGSSLIGTASFVLAMSPLPLVFMLIAMVMGGTGMGLFYTPNNTSIMLSVEPVQRGIAAGLRILMLNLGSAVGTAVVFAVLATVEPMQLIGNVFLGLTTSLGYRDKSLFIRGIDISFIMIGIISISTIALLILHKKQEARDLLLKEQGEQ